jgi:gamma-glutamylcyclotransferase
LYFAYGSNLDWAQIRRRCPSTEVVSVVAARGYRLAFTRFSTSRQCGAADILPSPGHEVWGMLYEIDEADIAALDECEGFRPGRPREENAYERVEIEVWKTGTHVNPQRVSTYVVVRKLDCCPRPSADYKRLMVDGARRWGFPASYLEQLEAIEIQ